MSPSDKRHQDIRNWRYAVCGRKVRYSSNEKAVIGLIDMKLYTGCKDVMTVYRCPTGNHWHYGHLPEKPITAK